MTSIAITAYSHPTATERDVHDLLWTKAAEAAARSGREPVEMTNHTSHEADDLVEHRADFTCKEIR